MIKKMAVFCGSNKGFHQGFAEQARLLGKSLAERNIDLVYGGGHVGLMGVLADACLEEYGKVIGVIPQFMIEKELAHRGLTELIITQTMHERKEKMAHIAEGFIALPGGIGTLEELIEIYTWLKLQLINAPIGLLNHKGYYNHLLSFLDGMEEHGFLRSDHRNRLIVDSDVQVLLDKMNEAEYRFEDNTWYITK